MTILLHSLLCRSDAALRRWRTVYTLVGFDWQLLGHHGATSPSKLPIIPAHRRTRFSGGTAAVYTCRNVPCPTPALSPETGQQAPGSSQPQHAPLPYQSYTEIVCDILASRPVHGSQGACCVFVCEHSVRDERAHTQRGSTSTSSLWCPQLSNTAHYSRITSWYNSTLMYSVPTFPLHKERGRESFGDACYKRECAAW